MLLNLTVKNFAIIEDINVNFNDKFTVVVGETGAGKSIFIEAVNLILGARANKTLVRDGFDKSFLAATFLISDEIIAYLDKHDIVCDQELEIVRILNRNGNSKYKLNGQVVTLNIINAIKEQLIEVKSQNDHLISNEDNYSLKILDQFAKVTDTKLYQDYVKLFKKYQDLKQQLVEVDTINFDIDYINMQIKRIEEIDAKPGELDELLIRVNHLDNASKIAEVAIQLQGDLDVLNNTSSAVLKNLATLNSYGVINQDFNELKVLIDDFSYNVNYGTMDCNYQELDYLEARIFELNKLYKMYGSYEEMQGVYEQLQEDLYQIEHRDQLILEINQQLAKLTPQLVSVSSNLTKYRMDHATLLEDEVNEVLNSLYMKDAKIKFKFLQAEYSEFGSDKLTLLISTNNNKLLPLDKIASGGEVSRVILAIKSVFVKYHQTPTVIFDEIDTGVSGRVALAMGLLMKTMAEVTQVIAISHLPQIVSIANHHLYVKKTSANNSISSEINYVYGDKITYLVAKLLSGENITDESLNNARSLINESNPR